MPRIAPSLVLAVMTLLAQPALADTPVVVPGSIAGYLYTGAGSAEGGAAYEDDKRISLAVFKLGDFTEYQIVSEPAGLNCDKLCSEKADKVPGGHITLKIVGNYPVPGTQIPLQGRWEAPCENTTTDTDICDINLTALNAQVRVKVSGELAAGAEITLPDGSAAMFVRLGGDHMLVAAHKKLSSPLTWVPFDSERRSGLGATDSNDGRNNMSKLVAAGSEAAQYCQQLGNGWYLPAQNELAALSTSATGKIPGYSTVWASTEYKFEYSAPKYADRLDKSDSESWSYRAYARNTSVTYLYAYYRERSRAKNSSTWVDSPLSVNSYQALCFRRIPL